LGAQDVELGEGLRRGTLFFSNFNQEFQVRGAILCACKFHEMSMILCHCLSSWIMSVVSSVYAWWE